MISVVVPVYNRRDLLVETVASVVNQTHTDWECLISDNASTDGTYDVAVELARADHRIRVVKNSSNIGPVLNWREGVANASGDWVKILFSDDLLEPRFLEEAHARVRARPEIECVYTKYHAGVRFAGEYIQSSAFIRRACWQGNQVSCSPSAYLLRKHRILAALERRLHTPAEQDLLMTGVGYDFACVFEAAIASEEIGYVDEILVNYRCHDGMLTATLGNVYKAGMLYCRTYEEVIRRSALPTREKVFLIFGLRLRSTSYGLRARRTKRAV